MTASLKLGCVLPVLLGFVVVASFHGGRDRMLDSALLIRSGSCFNTAIQLDCGVSLHGSQSKAMTIPEFTITIISTAWSDFSRRFPCCLIVKGFGYFHQSRIIPSTLCPEGDTIPSILAHLHQLDGACNTVYRTLSVYYLVEVSNIDPMEHQLCPKQQIRSKFQAAERFVKCCADLLVGIFQWVSIVLPGRDTVASRMRLRAKSRYDFVFPVELPACCVLLCIF